MKTNKLIKQIHSKSLNKIKGELGEKIACGFLEKAGYHIIKTNYRKKHGEIDIIAGNDKEGIINFIEVKTRSSGRFGKPFEAIDNKKKGRIIVASQMFMLENGIGIGKSLPHYGVISVEFLENSSVKLIYFENTFD